MPEQKQVEQGKKVVPLSHEVNQETRGTMSDVTDTSALDALLDEIDRTLEEQGQNLAENFIQRPGE